MITIICFAVISFVGALKKSVTAKAAMMGDISAYVHGLESLWL